MKDTKETLKCTTSIRAEQQADDIDDSTEIAVDIDGLTILSISKKEAFNTTLYFYS